MHPPGKPIPHSLQYAIVLGLQFPYSPIVWGVENMSDHEVLRFLRDNQGELSVTARFKLNSSDLKGGAEIRGVHIKRENKCYSCGLASPCPSLENAQRRRLFRWR